MKKIIYTALISMSLLTVNAFADDYRFYAAKKKCHEGGSVVGPHKIGVLCKRKCQKRQSNFSYTDEDTPENFERADKKCMGLLYYDRPSYDEVTFHCNTCKAED